MGTGITGKSNSLQYSASGKEEGLTGRNKENLKLNGSYLLHSQHVDAKV